MFEFKKTPRSQGRPLTMGDRYLDRARWDAAAPAERAAVEAAERARDAAWSEEQRQARLKGERDWAAVKAARAAAADEGSV